MDVNWGLISHIGLWLFLLMQFAILLYFLKQITQFLNRFRSVGATVEEKTLQIGEKAPLFRVKDERNEQISLADFNNKHTIMIFSSTTCGTCSTLLSQVPFLADTYQTNIFVLTHDKREKGSTPSIPNTYYISSAELFKNYYIKKVPTIYVIDKEGHIAARGDMNELESLLSVIPKQNLASTRETKLAQL